MMPEPTSSPQAQEIPKSLKQLLAEYRRKLWRIKITEAFLAGIIGLILSFLLVFALDRLLQTPAMLRLILLLAGTSLFAVFAPLWMRRWVWGHRRENDLARLIAQKQPDLGDRLLGIIELQEQQETKESLSPPAHGGHGNRSGRCRKKRTAISPATVLAEKSPGMLFGLGITDHDRISPRAPSRCECVTPLGDAASGDGALHLHQVDERSKVSRCSPWRGFRDEHYSCC